MIHGFIKFYVLLKVKMTQLKQAVSVKLLLLLATSATSVVAKQQTTDHVAIVAHEFKSIDNGSRVVGMPTMTSVEKINAADQPLLRLNLHAGVNPVATLTKPAESSMQIFELAARTGSGKTIDAKTPDTIEDMVVMRDKAFFDYVKQWDKKFRDYRKMNAPLGAVVEDFMATIGAISTKDYQGTLLADQYAKGIPMVFVVDSVQYLRGLQAYFIKHKITPIDPKPWAVIEVLNNPEAVTEADIAFWSGLFDVKKRSDDGVYQLLRDERDFRHKLPEIGSKGDYICHSPAETLLLTLEKTAGDFKTQKLLMMAVTAGTSLVVYDCINPKGMIKAALASGVSAQTKETLWTVAKVAAVTAAVYAAYRLYVNNVDGQSVRVVSEEEADLLDAVQQLAVAQDLEEVA
jgi:hypothetical protein